MTKISYVIYNISFYNDLLKDNQRYNYLKCYKVDNIQDSGVNYCLY